jgi:acetolactate synthase-1/2/3 large subunit
MPAPWEEGSLNPRDIITEIGRLVGEEAVVVTDVGQHQMLTALYFPFAKPRSLVSS